MLYPPCDLYRYLLNDTKRYGVIRIDMRLPSRNITRTKRAFRFTLFNQSKLRHIGEEKREKRAIRVTMTRFNGGFNNCGSHPRCGHQVSCLNIYKAPPPCARIVSKPSTQGGTLPGPEVNLPSNDDVHSSLLHVFFNETLLRRFSINNTRLLFVRFQKMRIRLDNILLKKNAKKFTILEVNCTKLIATKNAILINFRVSSWVVDFQQTWSYILDFSKETQYMVLKYSFTPWDVTSVK